MALMLLGYYTAVYLGKNITQCHGTSPTRLPGTLTEAVNMH